MLYNTDYTKKTQVLDGAIVHCTVRSTTNLETPNSWRLLESPRATCASRIHQSTTRGNGGRQEYNNISIKWSRVLYVYVEKMDITQQIYHKPLETNGKVS